MNCPTHQTEMEWVECNDHYAYPEGGYWFCEECRLDEEADFDPEYSDFDGEDDGKDWGDDE